MSARKVWLIGENNPFGGDEYFALYPEPRGCSGDRLCRLILGMQPAAYLRTFTRRNVLHQRKWSVPAARLAADELARQFGEGDRVILLGRKVFDAFDRTAWAYEQFSRHGRYLLLPHPSGLCRAWGVPGAFERARAAVLELAPELAPLIGLRQALRRAS